MTTPPTIDDPAYFARLAEVEASHWWSLGMWRLASSWLGTALDGRTNLRALDVGCGTGLTVARLAARPEIAQVVGLDPSPVALALARSRGVALVRGEARDLPFPSGSFDVVTSFDVWQHLGPGGDRLASREVARVLRPGGVALIRANGRGWGHDQARDGDGLPYRLADLAGLLTSAGLRVWRGSYANVLGSLAQEVRGRLARGAFRPHPSGGGLQIRLPRPAVNRFMRAVASAEAFAAGRLNRRLPFGHSTIVMAERARGAPEPD